MMSKEPKCSKVYKDQVLVERMADGYQNLGARSDTVPKVRGIPTWLVTHS